MVFMSIKIKRIFLEDDLKLKLISDIHNNDVIDITKILPLVTPGANLRQGLDEILYGNLGGLIVLGNNEYLKPILKGGIDLDIPFSSQKLFELSKMDGAIILSNNLDKIVGANKHLMPDRDIPSKETGIRHRSAEQTAFQSKLPVIAISHRRNIISLYYRDQKYILQDFNVLMIKANYAITNLKDFRIKIDERLKNLFSLEINTSFKLKDEVFEIIQTILYFLKHKKQVDDLVVELGSQGEDVLNTIYEITYGLEEELFYILKDYSNNLLTDQEITEKIYFLKQLGIRRISDNDKLLEFLEISNFLSGRFSNFPRGFRIFSKIIDLDKTIIEKLIIEKQSINNIKNLSLLELSKIIGAFKAKEIINYINKIYNKKL
jgi:diadenylate cyclase